MPLRVLGRAEIGVALLFASIVFVSAAGADETLRLDPRVRPVFQSVDLDIDPAETTFSGSVRIDVRVDRATSSIVLHAQGPEVTQAVIYERGEEKRTATVEAVSDDRIEVRVDEPLPLGTHRVELAFTTQFDSQAVALYRVDFEDEAYAFTQFQATEARKAFPCFDEPEFKIPWQVSLVVPDGHLAFSNTPVDSETELDDGRRKIRFARTPAMPSYLVALAVGPFDVVPVPGLGYPGNILCPKGKAHLAVDAVQLTPVILQALEAYFGTPYPYRKLDQVAVPEFWAGAMENAGLVTYRDTILLQDSARLTPGTRRYLITVITHELAHMWFGNLVTMKWWDDLWLNEAFATWIATRIDDELFPELEFDVDRVQQGLRAMQSDGQPATRAVRQPVTSMVNLLQSADALSYDKGRMVLGMFERWLGEDVFRQGVRDYLTAYRWGNAEASDLWEKLGEASGVDVGRAMSTFLDQPGVPVVDAELLDGGKVRLTQSRYFNGGDRDDDTLWHIPLRMKFADSRGEQHREILLTQRERVYDLAARGTVKWFHPNAEETGYYRWRLSGDGFLPLSEASSSLSVSEEVALYTAASIMLDSERMSGEEYLVALKRLGQNARPQSIGGLLGALGGIDQTFIDKDLEDAFAAYVRSIVEPIHERYGSERQDGEHFAVTDARSGWMGTLGRLGKSDAIRAFALERLEGYLADPTTVDPSLAGLVLRESARHGDAALFDRFVERAENSPVPNDRTRFLRTLAAFEDSELRDRALAYALEAPLPPQHVMAIPMAIDDSDSGTRRMMWEWMTSNYDTIAGKIPPPFLQYLPYTAMSCDGALLEEAAEFFSDPAHTVPGTEVEFAKMKQYSEDCAKLAARESSSVRAYLLRADVEG